MIFRFLISALALAGLFGCAPSYSPDTYASNAAQQANKVEQGVVVGVRPVAVSASGTVGAVAGGAAGGIAGAQVGAGPVSAFTALGGSLVGGLAGTTVEHVTGDTTAFEYIVRKPNGDLVSVTQKDKTPLALGQKVLVISGNQARVVPDYTVPPSVQSAKAGETASKSDAASSEAKPGDTKPADVKSGDTKSGDVKPGEAAAAAAPAGTASTAAPAATTSVGTPAASSTGTATPSEPKPPAAVPSGTVAAPTPGNVTSGAPPPTDRTAATAAKPANATP